MRMVYECKKCSRPNIIWNSRDGVTPFGTRCRYSDCDGDSIHKMQYATYRPDYVPQSGDMIWIDMPESIQVILAKKAYWESDYLSSELALDEFVKLYFSNIQQGQPYLIIIP